MPTDPTAVAWAIEQVKETRSSPDRLVIPPELQKYDDRRRFLAIQMADSREENYERPHDLAALAALVGKGELVEIPALTDDLVLHDVGGDAHEDPFEHYDVESGQVVPLVADAEALRVEEARLADLPGKQAAQLRSRLALSYAEPRRAAALFAEHAAMVQAAARLGFPAPADMDAAARERLETRLLSFLRPEARDVLRKLARDYHDRFSRRLPVVSMVRTARYQRQLARVNRNATRVLIPPHTTGEAFDITYRYMASDEQNFLMAEIAALESQGRVEAIREKRNCFHVFTFADGRRPPDTLVAEMLADVPGGPGRPHLARRARRGRAARH